MGSPVHFNHLAITVQIRLKFRHPLPSEPIRQTDSRALSTGFVSRFEKLDVIFLGFIVFVLIIEALR